MSNISPKVIDVEGNRIAFKDDKDILEATPGSLNATGKYSMFGLKSGKELNTQGRFPTQLFTNIKNNQFKYVKNIT